MKKTVLEYVQSTLSVMDSDEVDTVEETVESIQVAEQLKECYYELLNRQEWDFLKQAIAMISPSIPAEPTRFNSPIGLKRVISLRYNTSDDPAEYASKELKYLSPEEFLMRTGAGGDSRQLVTLPVNRIQFYVNTDRAPSFYTSFDDDVIYCDSYDSSQGATLVSSRLIGYGVMIPQFQVTDGFVPKLPNEMVPLLQASLNSASMLYFKQQLSSLDSIRETRQLAQARRQQNKFTKQGYYTNRYGRK